VVSNSQKAEEKKVESEGPSFLIKKDLLSETFETQFSSYNFHDVTEVVFFI
jgi:hypothetical protein